MLGQPIIRSVEVSGSNVDLERTSGVVAQSYDMEAVSLLRDILAEVRKMNTQLSIITGEEL